MVLQENPLKVLFCCTGIGVFNRGIESFFRDAYDGLRTAENLDSMLLKGGNIHERNPVRFDASSQSKEKVIYCCKRTSFIARTFGRLTGRSPYAVEQWSSFPFVVKEIRSFRPHVVFTSEANLMFLLRRHRRWIGAPFKVLYSMVGPVIRRLIATILYIRSLRTI